MWSPIIVEAARLTDEISFVYKFSKESEQDLGSLIPAYNKTRGLPTLEEFFRFIAYKRGMILDCRRKAKSNCGAHFNHW